MSGSRSSDGWLAAIPVVFVLIWSTGFIVARYGMPHAPPLSFLALRYALSIACFLAWIAWSKVAWPQTRTQWLHLSVTGVLMHAGYLGGVWVAVKAGMGSGLSSLIVGFQPVLTAIWVAYSVRGSDQPGISRRQWQGLLLGFLGLLLCAVPWLPAVFMGAVFIGWGYGPITPASSHLLARTTAATAAHANRAAGTPSSTARCSGRLCALPSSSGKRAPG